jgi:hypothetical protein
MTTLPAPSSKSDERAAAPDADALASGLGYPSELLDRRRHRIVREAGDSVQ